MILKICFQLLVFFVSLPFIFCPALGSQPTTLPLEGAFWENLYFQKDQWENAVYRPFLQRLQRYPQETGSLFSHFDSTEQQWFWAQMDFFKSQNVLDQKALLRFAFQFLKTLSLFTPCQLALPRQPIEGIGNRFVANPGVLDLYETIFETLVQGQGGLMLVPFEGALSMETFNRVATPTFFLDFQLGCTTVHHDGGLTFPPIFSFTHDAVHALLTLRGSMKSLWDFARNPQTQKDIIEKVIAPTVRPLERHTFINDFQSLNRSIAAHLSQWVPPRSALEDRIDFKNHFADLMMALPKEERQRAETLWFNYFHEVNTPIEMTPQNFSDTLKLEVERDRVYSSMHYFLATLEPGFDPQKYQTPPLPHEFKNPIMKTHQWFIKQISKAYGLK